MIYQAIKSNLFIGNLYHISFDEKLEGLWKPMLPAGSELGKAKYPEPTFPRISLSTDLGGCFRSVYPNVKKFFEENNFPRMTFAVYQPVFKGNERIIKPEQLTVHRMVWDAHVTKEHLILDPVKMKKVGELTVSKPGPEMFMAYPFEDTKLPPESVGPKSFGYVFTAIGK